MYTGSNFPRVNDGLIVTQTNHTSATKGFPKLTKSPNHFPKILLTSGDLKSRLYGKSMAKIGYSIQGLVAKVKDTIMNG